MVHLLQPSAFNPQPSEVIPDGLEHRYLGVGQGSLPLDHGTGSRGAGSRTRPAKVMSPG
jgi:hypothetical protein